MPPTPTIKFTISAFILLLVITACNHQQNNSVEGGVMKSGREPIDTALLFGIWTTDPEGPHTDFKWTKKSFFIVDYDGNGDMPFELIDRKLKVYFNDFIQEGTIQSVGKDSLIITWDDSDQSITYVRWRQ
jgi:hypothetical protein